MQSCLGVYIDNSMIKYAKIIKGNDDLKIESSGIIFFDNVQDALNQIIQETNSYKIPIAINLRGETYSYVDVFSILSKADIKKSIDIEFENLCSENGLNSNLYDTRFILSDHKDDPEMKNAMHIAVKKDDLDEITELFDYYKLETVMSEPVVISNLIKKDKNTNALIVNIEDSTTVTLIIKGEVKRVYQISDGMKDILRVIAESENSISKAYEVSKNMTISTQNTGMNDENEYLELVMPTINNIITKVGDIRSRINEDIYNLYVTGAGIAINNIDIYFQDFFEDIRCDMLRPDFLENKSLTLPVKEYMEVNSAIALAIEGINQDYSEINFRPDSSDVKKRLKDKKNKNGIEEKELLDSKEKLLIRVFVTILIFIVGYGILSVKINGSIKKAEDNISKETTSIEKSIEDINKDIDAVDSLAETYKDRLAKITGETTEDSSISNDALPNFLQQVMYAVPTDVVIVSIESITDTQMSIVAKTSDSNKIDKFKSTLQSEEILSDVKTVSNYMDGNDIFETITGELPR